MRCGTHQWRLRRTTKAKRHQCAFGNAKWQYNHNANGSYQNRRYAPMIRFPFGPFLFNLTIFFSAQHRRQLVWNVHRPLSIIDHPKCVPTIPTIIWMTAYCRQTGFVTSIIQHRLDDTRPPWNLWVPTSIRCCPTTVHIIFDPNMTTVSVIRCIQSYHFLCCCFFFSSLSLHQLATFSIFYWLWWLS